MKKRFMGWAALVLAVALLAACGAPPLDQSAGGSAPPAQTSAPVQPPPPESQPPAPPPGPEEEKAPESPPPAPEPDETEAPLEEAEPESEEAPKESNLTVTEDGWYNTKDEVALYIHLYNRLPENYVTKNQAEQKGWQGGSVEKYTGEGTAIGGNRFGNYEGLLPKAKGRSYTECDINTVGKKSRGAERIIFSNDGLVYYTNDHYKSFEQLYGEP